MKTQTKDAITRGLHITIVALLLSCVYPAVCIVYAGLTHKPVVITPVADAQPYTGASVEEWAKERMAEEIKHPPTAGEAARLGSRALQEGMEGEAANETTEAAECVTGVEQPPRYILTDEEKNMVMFVADSEDHSSVDSRLAVMCVIMNRVESDSFPNTVYDVLYAPKQFHVIYGYYNGYVPSDEAREALERLLSGENIVPGAIYFAASYVNPEKIAADLILVRQYAGQKYYKQN